MPRLFNLRAKAVVKFLTAHGFVLDHSTGSHFVYYHLITGRRAVVVRHNREIPRGTLMALLAESGFSRRDLEDFLSDKSR